MAMLRWLLACVLACLAVTATAPVPCVAVGTRQDCGYPGITAAECSDRGCCFNSSTHAAPWCSFPPCTAAGASQCVHGTCVRQQCVCDTGYEGRLCDQVAITTVHVVQSCHLDVGFADTAPNIVNRYFDHYFADAVAVAQALEANSSTSARLRFMTHPYLVSLFLDCPPGMGLHCPNASSLATFKAGVRSGAIWWHAFPFNGELALASPEMMNESVAVSHALSDAFGLPRSATLSQRDVPGITAGTIPLLRAAGVNSVTVGVNDASTPPDVPKIFKWVSPAGHTGNDGDWVVAMWHPHGYGGFTRQEAVTLPNSSHALVTMWNGDNAGPNSVLEYIAMFAAVELEFPGAKVAASTWADFLTAIEPHMGDLPVVQAEIADSWIHIAASVPVKMAKCRGMWRAWRHYLSSGGPRDAVYLNATRLATKCFEHTFGGDVKSYLFDNTDWNNTAFEAARRNPKVAGQFAYLEDTWWRQQAWAVDFAVEALHTAKHPLADLVDAELFQLKPSPPSPSDLSAFTKLTDPLAVLHFPGVDVAFGSAGGITTFTTPSTQWASASRPLFEPLYRTYSSEEVSKFIAEYIDEPLKSWMAHDFGKPNCTLGDPLAAEYYPRVQAVYVLNRTATDATSVVYMLSTFNTTAVRLAGAPAAVWTRLDIPSSSAATALNVTLTLVNKTATRLPEAMLYRLNPVAPPSAHWQMNKLGSWLPINTTVSGGSQNLHGVHDDGSVQLTAGASALLLSTWDAPVVRFGVPTGYPTPLTSPPDTATYGVSSLLFDNLWGTNSPQWIPSGTANTTNAYQPDLQFRYTLQWA